MGREARRVPMDFDWPLKQAWGGYLMPDRLAGNDCPDCNGGYTDAAQWLLGVAYVIAGLADDASAEARGRPMHPWLEPMRAISYVNAKRRPGAKFAEFADGIAPGAGPGMLGRDPHRVARALIAAAGLPDDWDRCPTCQGHGSVEAYPGQRDEADAWEATEPPTGKGWQMWETTSEGSPVSPVFATAEELADYCEGHVSVFGRDMITAARWLSIITGQDFAHVEVAPGVIFM